MTKKTWQYFLSSRLWFLDIEALGDTPHVHGGGYRSMELQQAKNEDEKLRMRRRNQCSHWKYFVLPDWIVQLQS